MKDEIKEILSLLNSSSWSNEAKQIEDYITNLQQEKEDYKSRCEKANTILNNIYMLDNVTITNNACEEIDKATNILQNGSDSQ